MFSCVVNTNIVFAKKGYVNTFSRENLPCATFDSLGAQHNTHSSTCICSLTQGDRSPTFIFHSNRHSSLSFVCIILKVILSNLATKKRYTKVNLLVSYNQVYLSLLYLDMFSYKSPAHDIGLIENYIIYLLHSFSLEYTYKNIDFFRVGL